MNTGLLRFGISAFNHPTKQTILHLCQEIKCNVQNPAKLPAVFFISLLLIGCAHPVSPGGGPKDVQPPQVLETKPPNGSPNFIGKKFTITFDEFIQLDNIAEEGLISPPVSEQPDFKVKGKSLVVKFNEELKPNTTYSVYFGSAIVDITENNPVVNYMYVFSTGDRVDSLSLQGEVVDAFNLDPGEGVMVLLYKNNNDTLPFDSLPLAVRPYYISKTDVNGKFMFHGLADESYLIFALADQNRNYIFDQPGEAVAFLDSLVVPQYLEPAIPDTAVADTTVADTAALSLPADSLSADSLKLNPYGLENLNFYSLYLFTHKDTVQKLLKVELLHSYTLRFSFSLPADDVDFKVLNTVLDSSLLLREFSDRKDTVTWYLKPLQVDTLKLLLMYRGDTLEMTKIKLTPREKLTARKKKKRAAEKQYLGWSTNVGKDGVLVLNLQPEILFDQPVTNTYTDSVRLETPHDTIYKPAFVFLDSLHRRIRIPLALEEESNYNLYFPDSAFTGWSGVHNREFTLAFRTKSLREYGKLILSLHPSKSQAYILQMLGQKETVVRQGVFNSDTTIVFEYVDPNKYLLKLIFDDNNNGMWDAGNYLEKKQPEKVLFFMKEVNVRGNWEIEEDWSF